MWPFTRSKVTPNIDLSGSWRHHEIWFIDGEMTGLDSTRDELLHLVAVPMRSGQLLIHNIKQWLIQPSKPLGANAAVQHHHITPSLLENAIPRDTFSSEVQKCLDGKIVAGHHVELDLSFINSSCTIKTIPLDTAQLFKSHQKKIQPHFPPERLDLAHVAGKLGCPLWPSHVALNDVLSCCGCFLKMTDDLEKLGIHELKDIISLS